MSVNRTGRAIGDEPSEGRADPRERLDKLIAAEDRLIGELIAIFVSRLPFDRWPDELKSALVRALDYQGTNDIEREKAEHLRRHLFLDAPPPRANRALAGERSAERVRADLAELVPFGAGLLILNDAGRLQR
jgi:hypothetical protein